MGVRGPTRLKHTPFLTVPGQCKPAFLAQLSTFEVTADESQIKNCLGYYLMYVVVLFKVAFDVHSEILLAGDGSENGATQLVHMRQGILFM